MKMCAEACRVPGWLYPVSASRLASPLFVKLARDLGEGEVQDCIERRVLIHGLLSQPAVHCLVIVGKLSGLA